MAKIPAKYLPGKFSIASWPAWIQMVVACFAGALFGGYAASTVAISKQDEAMERRMFAQSMDHFIHLGGEIIREPGALTERGLPIARRLGFYAIRDPRTLQKAIFCGGTFPGVKELDFAPLSTNKTGAGIADSQTMRLVARHFPELEYLDISNCRVEEIATIQRMKNIKKLKIINNPLLYAELQAIKQLDGVVEMWFGWPDPNLASDSLYRNPEVRKQIIKAISEMPSLKKLHLYNLRLQESERRQLSAVEVVNARL